MSMSTIQYSPEFVEKVKQAFPASADLHAALDEGSFSETLDLLHRDMKAAIHALPHPRKAEEMQAIYNLQKLWQDEITAYYSG